MTLRAAELAGQRVLHLHQRAVNRLVHRCAVVHDDHRILPGWTRLQQAPMVVASRTACALIPQTDIDAGEMRGELRQRRVDLSLDPPGQLLAAVDVPIGTVRHVPYVDELTPEDAAAIGRVRSRVAYGLRAELDIDFVHAMVVGTGVAHVHGTSSHATVAPRATSRGGSPGPTLLRETSLTLLADLDRT